MDSGACSSSPPTTGCLTCCECAVPIGADGPQRAALLRPCQHLLHVSCVEFLKRRAKLVRALASDMASWADDLPGGSPLQDVFPTAGFTCPGCGQPVSHIIPIFVPCDGARPSQAAEADGDFAATLRAQRLLLHRLRRLYERRDAVVDLQHACAALHTRHETALRTVERLTRQFPSLARDGAETAAAARSLGVAPLSALEAMGSTELELYLTQAAPLLAAAQAALRRERRGVERRRLRATLARSQYYAVKEATVRCPRSVRGTEADSPLPTGSSAVAIGRRWRKRQRPVAAVDVDHTASAPPAAPPASTHSLPPVDVDGYDVDADPDDVTVAETVGPSTPGDRTDAVADSDSDGGGSSGGGGSVAAFEDGAVEDVEGEDAVLALGMLPPSVVQRAHRGGPPPRKISANHLRMLPRMEDRLWQPSLHF